MVLITFYRCNMRLYTQKIIRAANFQKNQPILFVLCVFIPFFSPRSQQKIDSTIFLNLWLQLGNLNKISNFLFLCFRDRKLHSQFGKQNFYKFIFYRFQFSPLG